MASLYGFCLAGSRPSSGVDEALGVHEFQSHPNGAGFKLLLVASFSISTGDWECRLALGGQGTVRKQSGEETGQPLRLRMAKR